MKNSIQTLLIGIILMGFSSKTLGQANTNTSGTLWSSASSYTLTSTETNGTLNEIYLPKSVSYTNYEMQNLLATNNHSPAYSSDTSAELFIYNTKNPFFVINESEVDSSSAKANSKLSDDDFFLWGNETEESNIDYFAIEKSIDDEDYFEIGYLKTSGIQPPDYNTASRIQAGGPLCYYRIKKVDNMGNVKYSKKLIIISNDTTSMRSIKLVENNHNKNMKATFSLYESCDYMVSVTDVNGSMISTMNGKGEKGENSIILDTKKLLRGNYYIYITNAKGLSHVTSFCKKVN